MTKKQLKELEDNLTILGYKKYVDHLKMQNETYYWSKSIDDENGNYKYICLYYIYDFKDMGDAFIEQPVAASFKVIAQTLSGKDYRLSHSVTWCEANVDDLERIAAEFYEFIKYK